MSITQDLCRSHSRVVWPSILSADLLNLRDDLNQLTQLGMDTLHVDVMDGHFVPNLTFGPGLVQQLRSQTLFHLDVHLMIELESPLIDAFIKSGAHHLTFHVEATNHPQQIISYIQSQGLTAGLSLKPNTSASSLLPYLSYVDQILVMTVEPGFGGQAFMESQLGKIEEISAMIKACGRPITLAVDGGINTHTIGLCAHKGAQAFIVGNGLFAGGRDQFPNNYKQLLQDLEA